MIVAIALACTDKLPTATLTVGEHRVHVEIAQTYAHRQLGLMHRDQLGSNAGMLFVYPDEKIRGFWMKDTRIPLSIAYANRSGEIVRIADMQPFDKKRVSSLAPATYALEVNQGWFAEHDIVKGIVIEGIPADLDPE